MAKASTTRRIRTPAKVRSGDQRALEIALIRVLGAVRDHPLKLLKSRAPSKTFMNKALEALEGVELSPGVTVEGYALYLLWLARGAGLVAEREGSLELEGLATDVFFALPAHQRLERLREAWLDADDLNEFLMIPTLESVAGRGGTISEIDMTPGVARMKVIRRAVVSHLETLPEGNWTRFGEFSEQVATAQPELLVPRTTAGRLNTPRIYMGIRKRGDKAEIEREGNWAQVEGALLEIMAKLPLLSLGYLDLGEDGEEVALRRRRPAGSDEPFVGSERPFALEANFEVLAFLPEMDTPVLWKLMRFASLLSCAEVARLRLEERYVARAINEGMNLSDICAFLEKSGRTGLAANVRFSLEAWTRNAQRIAIYLDAFLFEAEGNEDINTLIREPYRKRAPLTVLGERHLIGSAGACPDPREGIAPRYPVLDYSRPLPAPVRASADGLLSCSLEQVNFRVVQALSRLAERESLERWRISRESWRNAIERGLPFERAMTILASAVKDELPPLLTLRLMAWAGKIEAVSARPVLLLECWQPEVARLLNEAQGSAKVPLSALNATTFACEAEDKAALLRWLEELSLPVEKDE